SRTLNFLYPKVCASRPLPHHGPHLCVAVLPLRAVLGRQSLPAPPPHPAQQRHHHCPCCLPGNGCHDPLQDLPGLPAQLPPHLQLHSLSSALGQPRRAHLQGSQGRAYLFNSVVNVGCGPAEERVLLTGLHAVADIYCENCKTTLGWKYEHAFESSQKYKEGKFIIELAHMIKDNGWD
uniref:Yippee domain-containing protein n=1 Tax=Esox lucius TaxID=8010 RepID=A0A3P8YBD6_ESOLU